MGAITEFLMNWRTWLYINRRTFFSNQLWYRYVYHVSLDGRYDLCYDQITNGRDMKFTRYGSILNNTVPSFRFIPPRNMSVYGQVTWYRQRSDFYERKHSCSEYDWTGFRKPTEECMRQWIGSSLVQIMVYRLFSIKPLPNAIIFICIWSPEIIYNIIWPYDSHDN